jgi:hypothetical protein
MWVVTVDPAPKTLGLLGPIIVGLAPALSRLSVVTISLFFIATRHDSKAALAVVKRLFIVACEDGFCT